MTRQDWEAEFKDIPTADAGTVDVIPPTSDYYVLNTKEGSRSRVALLLALTAIFMSFALGYAIYVKDPSFYSFSKPVAGEKGENRVFVPVGKDHTADVKMIMEELRKIKESQGQLHQEMQVLGQKVKIQGDRIILLGTIANDNSVGVQRGDRDPLFLNPDWTLPRYPRYLKLDGPDADFLRNHVKD